MFKAKNSPQNCHNSKNTLSVSSSNQGQTQEICLIHSSKIKELHNKIQDLKLASTDLKIRNDQIIKMIAERPQQQKQIQERAQLWKNKYYQLKKSNNNKQELITKNEEQIQINKGRQTNHQSKTNTIKRRRSSFKFEGLSDRQANYIDHIRESSREHKRGRKKSIQKQYTANLPDGLIVKIIDKRAGFLDKESLINTLNTRKISDLLR